MPSRSAWLRETMFGCVRFAIPMTRHPHLRLAGSAIAAALALGTTPAIGQDAAASPPPPAPITIVIPQPAAAPAPAPVAQVKTVAAPVAEDSPKAAASTRRPAASVTAQRSRTTAARPPVTPAPVAETNDAPIATPAETAQFTVDQAPMVAAEPIASPAAASDDGAELLLGAGLAGALGLGGLLAFARRRRGRREVIYDEAAPVEPTAVAAMPEPAPVAPRTATPQWTTPAAFAMPAAVPEDELARCALIHRMVAAKPDAANPFKTCKSRTRRARLILADRIAHQRPPLEDRVVARDVAPAGTNPHREFEQA